MSSSRMNVYTPLVRDFSARVVLFHQAIAEALGLHVTDVKVLRLLEDHPMTPTQLADDTNLTGAAVTALVDRLVIAGYVTRQRDERDRRRVTVRVVPAKVRALNRMYEAYGADMEALLAKYSAAEFSAIVSYLEKTGALLDEHTARIRKRSEPA